MNIRSMLEAKFDALNEQIKKAEEELNLLKEEKTKLYKAIQLADSPEIAEILSLVKPKQRQSKRGMLLALVIKGLKERPYSCAELVKYCLLHGWRTNSLEPEKLVYNTCRKLRFEDKVKLKDSVYHWIGD